MTRTAAHPITPCHGVCVPCLMSFGSKRSSLCRICQLFLPIILIDEARSPNELVNSFPKSFRSRVQYTTGVLGARSKKHLTSSQEEQSSKSYDMDMSGSGSGSGVGPATGITGSGVGGVTGMTGMTGTTGSGVGEATGICVSKQAQPCGRVGKQTINGVTQERQARGGRDDHTTICARAVLVRTASQLMSRTAVSAHSRTSHAHHRRYRNNMGGWVDEDRPSEKDRALCRYILLFPT